MQLTEDQIRRIARQEGKKIVNGGGGVVIGGGAASGSSENAREAQHAKEADHAASADKATEADHAASADKATEADHATKAAGLDDGAQAALDNKYLRKDQDDETEHKLTMGEAEVTGDAAVKGDLKIGKDGSYTITKEGIATLAGIVAEYLKSSNFRPGTAMGFDGQGYGITKGTDGKYTLEIDNLIARMKMIVAELEVHEMSFIGGTVVMSTCGNRVDRVEALDDKGNCIAAAYGTQPTLTIPSGKTAEKFRCYFLASDGDRQIKNEWTVGQLARAKTNNIAAPGNYANYENRDYWRLVVGVSSNPVSIDGKDYHWIDLSNSTSGSIKLTDAAGTTWYYGYGGVSQTLNSLPFAGDNIIGMGHGWDDTRKNVAILSVDSLGWKLYKGINHYDLPDENIVNQFSIDKTIVTTDHFILRPYAAPAETQTVAVVRGEYSDTANYGHNDMVTYEGQTWIASGVAIGDTIMGDKPSVTSIYWSLAAAKGIQGETPTFAKLRVDHSALHYNPTTQKWDYDSVTVTIVIFTPEGTRTPGNNDISEYYWLLDNDSTKRASGWGFSKSLDVASHTATLYKVGSNVPLDTITVPMVRDGEKGATSTGAAATVYTIEPCANFEATGKLTDASHVTVSISGDVRVYKTIGDQKTLCGSGDGVYAEYFRLSIGGTNYDGEDTFTYDGGNIKVSKTIPYEVGKNKNNVPGSATITLYDLISGGTVGNQLASLVVPVSLNPGAIVDVNSELGTIESTTASMQGTIETIKQGQGKISLKVQEIERKSRNLISGGNVTGLFNKQYEAFRSSAFTMEQGKTYTVTARLWLESASNGHNVIAFVFGADDSWNYAYSSDRYTNTSASVVRFKFTAGGTKQMVVAFYEQDRYGSDPGSGSYNGVHIGWLRVDEGDWTGLDAKGETDPNGRTLDAWTPSDEEIDALNLLPDPDFSEPIGYSDYMGERNSYDDNMGDYVSWMSRNSTSVDGACGVLFNRSGATSDTSAGLRYIVPFRGAGTYSISCFVKDLHQTNSYRPAWDSGKLLAFECYPMDANKTRITGGFAIYATQNSQRFGDEQTFRSYTFGTTATRDNGNGTTTEIEIAYLEVRVFLQRNGSVRVSRLCLSKSDHFTYWNANELSEERKKEAAQLATGIDIKSHKIIATADNFVVRNNSGDQTFSIDRNGNIVGNGNASFKGTVYASGGSFTGTVTANEFSLTSDKFTAKSDGTFKLDMSNFKVSESGIITAKGGSISFLKFDEAGMYGGVVSYSTPSYCTGISITSTNISVGGSGGGFLSNVFLGNGRSDFRTSTGGVRVRRVGGSDSNFYNYIRLTNAGAGSVSVRNEDAALGVETDGNFCITALGGPSAFQGLCLPSGYGSYMTADGKRTMYRCTGGTFKMPSNPPVDMVIIVIQTTNNRITFDGNGHSFRSGNNTNSTADSSTPGQWTVFFFNGSEWETVYLNGRPF